MTSSLSFEDLCQTARAHFKAGKLADAQAAFEEAQRLNELDVDVHEGLATIFFLKGTYEDAVKHFERVTRLDPRRGPAWVNLGAVYNRMGNYQKAAEVLRRAVQIEKKSAPAYYNLGIAYKHLKQWAMAVPAYREAIRLDPKMADAYLNLGNVYVAMKNLPQAASHYRKALQIDPNLERAKRGLEKAEAELQAGKEKISPFGRLVKPDEPTAADAAAAPVRELTDTERAQDRRQLTAFLAEIAVEYDELLESIEEQLSPAVQTLNKMLTQPLSPHGVSITKSEALDQFVEARSHYMPRLAKLQATLRQLRDHEAEFK
jgi:tetratricopeptide (TPR) repeat protein